MCRSLAALSQPPCQDEGGRREGGREAASGTGRSAASCEPAALRSRGFLEAEPGRAAAGGDKRGWRSPPGGTAPASPQVRQHLAARPSRGAAAGGGEREAGSRCRSRCRWGTGRRGATGRLRHRGGESCGKPTRAARLLQRGHLRRAGSRRAVSRQASSPPAGAGRCGGGLARGKRVRARRHPGTPQEVNAWLEQVEKSEEQGNVYAILRGLCFGGVAVWAGYIFVSSF